MTTPEPPVNVALVLSDRSRVPVECTFEGWEDDMAVWLIFRIPDRVRSSRDILAVTAEKIPAKTAIRLSLREGE